MADGEKPNKEWDILLKQYECNRQEQLDKKDRLFKIMGLGVGGIATLLGIAYQFHIYTLILVIPLLILTSMLIYDAECNAVINMSDYGYYLERKIISDQGLVWGLGWENWLRNNKNSDKRFSYYFSELGSLIVLFLLYLWSILGIIFELKAGSAFFYVRNKIAVTYFAIGILLFLVFIRKAGKRYDPRSL